MTDGWRYLAFRSVCGDGCADAEEMFIGGFPTRFDALVKHRSERIGDRHSVFNTETREWASYTLLRGRRWERDSHD